MKLTKNMIKKLIKEELEGLSEDASPENAKKMLDKGLISQDEYDKMVGNKEKDDFSGPTAAPEDKPKGLEERVATVERLLRKLTSKK